MAKGQAVCHPERKHVAKGLCKKCYYKDYKGRAAICHPDKARATVDGLCSMCWGNTPEGKARKAAAHRVRKYDLTPEQYKELYSRQNGRCAICGAENPDCIDHDHISGTVRGLLCRPCNYGLGHFKDRSDFLIKAANYVNVTDGNKHYIMTFLGHRFYPLRPRVEDVFIEDIAHSLAQQCRFTGHTKKPVTTAEHCVRVSQFSANEDMLAGLLHDAGEAYASDVARPLKHQPIMAFYRELEHNIQAVVFKRFGLGPDKPPSVAVADKMMTGIEARDQMHPIVLTDERWAEFIDPIRDHPFSMKEPWAHERAEREFLVRYYQLTYNNQARASQKDEQR